ncbi:hypothetical protein HHA02_08190 [Cobetia marina]|nr:hypothetical protein HHA02_08190 [Cobetia marina]
MAGMTTPDVFSSWGFEHDTLNAVLLEYGAPDSGSTESSGLGRASNQGRREATHDAAPV